MSAGRWYAARTHTAVRSLHGPDGLWEVALARPHPRLRPGVISYRGFRLALGTPRRRLEVPIGAVTLLLGFGDRLRIRGLTGSARPPVSLVSVVSGLTTRPVIGEHDGRLAGVEVLQQIVSSELDLFVPPFRSAVHAGDQGRTVHASKVAVYERIAGLRLLVRAAPEPVRLRRRRPRRRARLDRALPRLPRHGLRRARPLRDARALPGRGRARGAAAHRRRPTEFARSRRGRG